MDFPQEHAPLLKGHKGAVLFTAAALEHAGAELHGLYFEDFNLAKVRRAGEPPIATIAMSYPYRFGEDRLRPIIVGIHAQVVSIFGGGWDIGAYVFDEYSAAAFVHMAETTDGSEHVATVVRRLCMRRRTNQFNETIGNDGAAMPCGPEGA